MPPTNDRSTSALRRRLCCTVASDAATVAIGLPSAFGWGEESDFDEATSDAVVGFTGADGAYGAYEVLDASGAVVGTEVVISSPGAEAALEAYLADRFGGWEPDDAFFDRYLAKTATPEELRTYNEYSAVRSGSYGEFLDRTVESSDPAEEGRAEPATGTIEVPDGRLYVCDPYCLGSGRTVTVSPGSYRPVRWMSADDVHHPLRIGLYRTDLAYPAP